MTTCKRLTNSLPKLSLITLSPPETAGYQVCRIYGRTCQCPSGFISWGYRGEYFSSSTWGKSEKVYHCGWWDLNPRPQNPWSADDAICEGISGASVRLTSCKRLTNSFPKLSLITIRNDERGENYGRLCYTDGTRLYFEVGVPTYSFV